MLSFRSRLRGELRTVHKGAAVWVAVFLVAVWLIVFFMIGSPRMLIRWISGRVAVPPTWLFTVMLCVFYALCGLCAGAVLFSCRKVDETSKYRGAFFFSLALMASYLWYALFFGARFFLVAAVLSLAAMLTLMLSVFNFCRVLRLCSLLWGAVVWCGYCVTLSLLCFFFL